MVCSGREESPHELLGAGPIDMSFGSNGIDSVASNPDSLYRNLELPPSVCFNSRSISVVPKPFLAGFLAGGPPASLQCNTRRGKESLWIDHVAETRPSGRDRLPYLAALVVSSWTTKPSASAATGLTWMSGPLISTCSPASCGLSCSVITSRSGTSFQFSRDTRL